MLDLLTDDSKPSFKAFLTRCHFTVDNGIFEQIDDDDYLEVFDLNAEQIYRSINLFRINTYSFEDFSQKSFDELYDRPEFFTKLLFKSGFDVLSGKTNFLVNVCPTHIVKEKKDNGAEVEISYKFMAPVKSIDTNAIVGVLVCEKLKVIENSTV